LDYIRLAPGFAREVLESYETWEGEKETLPWKELMLILQIELSKLYKQNIPSVRPERPIVLKDAKLDRM
jgi:hypothetical protein